MPTTRRGGQRIYTAGGGVANAMSLAQLTAWCDAVSVPIRAGPDLRERPYDIPWVAMDSDRRGARLRLACRNADAPSILEEIAAHAESIRTGWSGVVCERPAGAQRPGTRSELLSDRDPCRNEEGAIASTVEHLYVELRLHGIQHEIVPGG